MKGSSCCLGSVEESNEALLVSAAHGLELNAVLIDLECRHGLNSSGLSSASVGVDIDLHQLELRVSRHMALINGTNHSAGRAPGSCKVNDERLATIGSRLDGRLEGSLVGKVQFSQGPSKLQFSQVPPQPRRELASLSDKANCCLRRPAIS